MFNNIFGKKPTVKEQQRENDRSLKKATRDIERERRKMEEEEKKLEADIRRNAAAGNNDACRILAKQLVEIRKQKSRSYAAAGKIQSIGFQNKNMGANIALSEAMGTTAKTMADMNKVMRPEAIAGTVRDFQAANMKMEMTDEMINDTLDDMLNESGDEEESNAVVNKVLDEIGIEISGKMSNIPATGSADFETSGKRTEKDIADQLAKLRSS
ncbi:charged multivesicular body protein 2b-B [Drosophila madeirensis]|uniref:Blast:Charged multivesicular body protein 2b-B n=2 Tax=obscura subgroup TaxID=32357 RepID=A0A3B0KMV1_DROGU|nr:charged multivesicular body protein 2b-B [Drosophila guanche]XP_034655277.1 charged multivesicular body protein 2b-B [Drosophila subobscura]SPP87166.1 blast:Charged multivesicular body protein 2b-B [Drosophila guanche]